MKNIRISICIWSILFFPSSAQAEALSASHLMKPVLRSAAQELQASIIDLSAGLDDAGVPSITFNVFLENISSQYKKDIIMPLDITLEDEFGNRYRQLATYTAKSLNSGDGILSLYPGSRESIFYRFQAPVQQARVLSILVSDAKQDFQQRVRISTDNIRDWRGPSGDAPLSDDDMIIVYPRDQKVFSPGETVFLKLGFSDRAGRPSNIHIIVPDYIMMDDKASGNYEVKVPEKYHKDKMQIEVLAQWGPSSAQRIVSKTLVLHIKG